MGTQDSLGTRTPRVIDDARARKMAQDLSGDYIETCATYGMNIDRVFSDATLKILRQRHGSQPTIPNSTPLGANRSAKNSSTPLRNQVQAGDNQFVDRGGKFARFRLFRPSFFLQTTE